MYDISEFLAKKELISKYRTLKINIEKKWKSPRTVKGYDENLDRVIEIFAVVTGDENYPINSLTKELMHLK